MKFLNLNKVLCLSAHPDDAEYSMLGSMIKFHSTQFDIVVLSNGGDFDKSSGQSREKECNNTWSNFKNVSGNFLSTEYLKDKLQDEWINIIENNYDINNYNVIFTPTHLDSHFEHRLVNKVAKALLRTSSCGLISYRSPSTLEEWTPNYYVNINTLINKKIAILNNFESQKSKSYFKSDSIHAFHSNYMSSKFGINYVEHYKIERLFTL